MAGSLLVADYEQYIAGTAELRVIFEPDAHTSLGHYAWTRDRLILVTLRRRGQPHPGHHTGQLACLEPVAGVPNNTNTMIPSSRRLQR